MGRDRAGQGGAGRDDIFYTIYDPFSYSMSLKSQLKLEIGHCLLLCQSYLLLFLQVFGPFHKIIAGSGSEETKEDLKQRITAFDKYLKGNNSKYIGGELLLLLNVAGIYWDETQEVGSSYPLAVPLPTMFPMQKGQTLSPPPLPPPILFSFFLCTTTDQFLGGGLSWKEAPDAFLNILI